MLLSSLRTRLSFGLGTRSGRLSRLLLLLLSRTRPRLPFGLGTRGGRLLCLLRLLSLLLLTLTIHRRPLSIHLLLTLLLKILQLVLLPRLLLRLLFLTPPVEITLPVL